MSIGVGPLLLVAGGGSMAQGGAHAQVGKLDTLEKLALPVAPK